MKINRVEYGGRVLVDLMSDTVSENTLAKGVTAHNSAGEQITGTLELPNFNFVTDDGVIPMGSVTFVSEGGSDETLQDAHELLW